jgi:hypothetical protein
MAKHLLVIQISLLHHLHHRVLRDLISNHLHHCVMPGRVKRLSLGNKLLDADLFKRIPKLLIDQLYALLDALHGLTRLSRMLQRKTHMVDDRQKLKCKLLISVFAKIGDFALHSLAVILEIGIGPETFIICSRRLFGLLFELP